MRRSSLILPFGPGALHNLRNGIAVITAGLDHWYEANDNSKAEDLEEFRIAEWRLQQQLQVDYFMLPPEYRRLAKGIKTKNAGLTIPAFRFPCWFVCSRCGRMEEQTLTRDGFVYCPECLAKGKKFRMSQIRFICMCDQGHVQDFPWREWVHRSHAPNCNQPLFYKASGASALSSIRITCACGQGRTLESVFAAEPDGSGSYLSRNLEGNGAVGTPYLCSGKRMWLGDAQGMGCGRPLRAALRSGTNVYYGEVRSAIFIPPATATSNGLLDLLRSPEVSVWLNLAPVVLSNIEDYPGPMRKNFPQQLSKFSDAQICAGIRALSGTSPEPQPAAASVSVAGEDQWTGFRRAEYNILTGDLDYEDLKIQQVDLSGFPDHFKPLFQTITLVKKLRETRAFCGFSRVFPENNLTLKARQGLLRLSGPPAGQNWLPAYVVYGEGIFLALNEARLRDWEKNTDLQSRIDALADRYDTIHLQRGYPPKAITPRFLLLHTLAHLLINRLNFECGYSSASLRERIYASTSTQSPMSGLLIYTSSGDAEGTLGGLVRMGRPEHFLPLLNRALQEASWCSADPVCAETGDAGGQGPDSCNLAACHNCCLLPETACEEFNRFLDRSLVVKTPHNSELGFFESISP